MILLNLFNMLLLTMINLSMYQAADDVSLVWIEGLVMIGMEGRKRSCRVMLTTFGSLGDLHPYIAIALKLKERGHEPVVATMDLFRAKVEKVGLPSDQSEHSGVIDRTKNS